MKNNTNPEIVAIRQTFDGVTVRLHADGSVSDRLNFLPGGRLPVDSMWRLFADVCLYMHSELPTLIRKVKSGKWRPFAIRVDRPEPERVYREIVTTCGVRLHLRVR